jgi:hypothetical protein
MGPKSQDRVVNKLFVMFYAHGLTDLQQQQTSQDTRHNILAFGFLPMLVK